MKQHELILKIITMITSLLLAAAVYVYLLVIEHNSTEVGHIFCEDSVASGVVRIFIAGESLRNSSDILDTSGNNPQEN